MYLLVLDNLCSEFERRFDETQCSVMRGIQALNPTNEHFAELEQIRSFAEAYDADVVDLEHELHQVKRLIARLHGACDAFHELHRLNWQASSSSASEHSIMRA